MNELREREGERILFIYLKLFQLIDPPITPPYILSMNYTSYL